MANNKLQPVVLNDYNEKYGEKNLPYAWEEAVQLFQELYIPPFESGGYGYVIQELEKGVMKKVTTNPEKMDELDLVKLYLVGKSHLALGNEEAAIRCFKIIQSQIGFQKYILPEYHKYLVFAIDELENLVKTLGYDSVNSVIIPKVESPATRSEEKRGCFIATAVYGSPMAKEVNLLQCFRDEILLKFILGRFFVSTYYLFSPLIAKVISGSDLLRNVVRTLIISPLLRIEKRKLAKNEKKLNEERGD
ncbi:MAG: CFI-box-CTERM domain-containing protein [candidate division WOR-3 bacterium]